MGSHRRAFALAIFLALFRPESAWANDTDTPRPCGDVSRLNHPPKLPEAPRVDSSIPGLGGTPPYALRMGRKTEIRVTGADPDDDSLTYAVRPLPAGATFDQEHGVLTWTPTPNQDGEHQLAFEVSDGKTSDQRRWRFTVQPNRPPVATNDRALVLVAQPEADSGHAAPQAQRHLLAHDPDGDRISFEIRRLPVGATVSSSTNGLSFVWSPGPADVGEHEVIVAVSDGELTTTVQSKVVVFPSWAANDYRGWLLLGGGPSGFVSHGDGEVYVGGAFDATLVALRERATHNYGCAEGRYDDCHASHHRFYAEFEVLAPIRSPGASLFTYGAGYSASLRWVPLRRTLIPHYGVELGGLVRSGLGHRAQTRPYLGLHLFASRQIWINATLGYRVVPAELRDLSGPTCTLRAILNPW